MPAFRIGRELDSDMGAHVHQNWDVGDRVVVEPKKPTAAGWTYRSPRGVVVVGPHLSGCVSVVSIQLDGETEPREASLPLLTRERTFDKRSPRKQAS